MTSLVPRVEATDAQVVRLAAGLCGLPEPRVAAIRGGGNNRVFRVDAGDKTFALKSYPADGDSRDRLGTEFDALRYLAEHGVEAVPRALAASRENGFALYEWIDGNRVGAPGTGHVEAALALVENLASLARRPDAAGIKLASEACLCGKDIADQIAARLDRLSSVAMDGSPLRKYLDEEFEPAYRRMMDDARHISGIEGVDFDTPLDPEHQTLSPSDFGFHNALQRDDGTVVFLDLEYFGRDDPVKLVSDFLHHPGMTLGVEAKRQFTAGGCRIFAGDVQFETRLALYYPLYGLRWCMILLNEFLPEGWARRRRAGGTDGDAETARAVQLEKARAQLVDVCDGGGVFCHGE